MSDRLDKAKEYAGIMLPTPISSSNIILEANKRTFASEDARSAFIQGWIACELSKGKAYRTTACELSP